MALTAQGVQVLRLAEVWKSFDGVDAVKGVTFEAQAGEIHALLGENGAGKSTLMAIAAGSLAPDRGQLELKGEPVGAASPVAIHQRGLSIAYQHPGAGTGPHRLREHRHVAARPGPGRPGKTPPSWARSQLARVGCRAGLGQRVSSLSVAQRHLLEVAKALASDPAVLILDEPTAALGADDSATLFAELRRMAASGVAVVYITHRLAEVRELCQRVTVLRDGSVRGTFAVQDVSDAQLLELIVGPGRDGRVPAPRPPPGRRPRRGGGGAGAGRAELLRPRLPRRHADRVGRGDRRPGRDRRATGRASSSARWPGWAARPAAPTCAACRSSRAARTPRCDAGVVYLSADRLSEGLFGTLSVRENALVSALGQFSRWGVTNQRAEARAVEAQRDNLSIKASSIEANVLSLSGGNQQKVLLARALLNQQVTLLLAEEPTQDVDVGARAEIYRILRQVADAGASVVIVSSDIRELEGLCDRVVVFSSGQVVAELRGDRVREDAIAHAMLTSTRRRAGQPGGRRTAPRRHRRRGTRRWAGPGPGCATAGRSDYAASGVLAIAIVVAGPVHAGPQLALPVHLQPDLADRADRRHRVHLVRAGVRDPDRGHRPVRGTAGRPGRGDRLLLREQRAQRGRHRGRVPGHDRGRRRGRAAERQHGPVRPVHAHRGHAGHLHRPAGHLASCCARSRAGYISFSILNAINRSVGPVAIAFLAAVVVAIAMEWALHRARWGRSLRAIGSDPAAAFRLGVRPGVTVIGAYVASALFACVGGVLLMAQVGVGDPTQGVNYTLASVTAVVLGGTSIFGGRGSFVGALFGAVLVEQLLNVTTFLQLSQAWQYWFQGVLVMVAVGIYTQARARAGGLPQVRAA